MAKKAAKKEVLEPLAFDRDDIVKLMKVAFGSKTAGKETNEFLTEKMTTLADHLDDEELAELEETDKACFETATAILEANAKGQQVLISEAAEEVDDDETEVDDEEVEADEEESDDEDAEVETEDEEDDEEEEEEEAPKKKGKAAPPKAAAKPAPAKKGAKVLPPQPAKKGKAAAPVKGKKPAAKEKKESKPRGKGVIYTVVKLLSQATEKQPVSKAQIVAVLTKKFPDRDPDNMTTTVNSQINGQLKANKNVVLGKKEKKDGTTGYWIKDIGDYELAD